MYSFFKSAWIRCTCIRLTQCSYAEALPALEQKPFVPIDNSMFNASQRSQSQSRPPSAPRVDDPLPSEIPSDIFSQSLHRTQPDVPVPSLPMPPPTPPAPVFVSRPLVVDIFPAPPVLVACFFRLTRITLCSPASRGSPHSLLRNNEGRGGITDQRRYLPALSTRQARLKVYSPGNISSAHTFACLTRTDRLSKRATL